MKIAFTIPGKPTGKGRPRFARRGAFVATALKLHGDFARPNSANDNAFVHKVTA